MVGVNLGRGIPWEGLCWRERVLGRWASASRAGDEIVPGVLLAQSTAYPAVPPSPRTGPSSYLPPPGEITVFRPRTPARTEPAGAPRFRSHSANAEVAAVACPGLRAACRRPSLLATTEGACPGPPLREAAVLISAPVCTPRAASCPGGGREQAHRAPGQACCCFYVCADWLRYPRFPRCEQDEPEHRRGSGSSLRLARSSRRLCAMLMVMNDTHLQYLKAAAEGRISKEDWDCWWKQHRQEVRGPLPVGWFYRLHCHGLCAAGAVLAKLGIPYAEPPPTPPIPYRPIKEGSCPLCGGEITDQEHYGCIDGPDGGGYWYSGLCRPGDLDFPLVQGGGLSNEWHLGLFPPEGEQLLEQLSSDHLNRLNESPPASGRETRPGSVSSTAGRAWTSSGARARVTARSTCASAREFR